MSEWSPEDDATLHELYLTHSHEEIGARLGKTRSAVRNRCYRLKLRKQGPPWTDGEIETIRVWYSERVGKAINLKELAAQLGRDHTSVATRAKEMGLTTFFRQHKERAEDGMTDAERSRLPRFSSQEERSAFQSETAKERIRTIGHPRGALGMKHTEATKARMAEATRAWQAAATPEQREARRVKVNATKIERYGTAGPVHLLAENAYSRARGGKREDLDNRYFRSMWEANYARYLRWLKEKGEIADWQYEPQIFVFHGVTRGVLTYTPDFKVIEHDGSHCWHEVKGWMDPKSKAKLKRMAKFYPGEKIIIISEDEYKAVAKWRGMIPGWETTKNDR